MTFTEMDCPDRIMRKCTAEVQRARHIAGMTVCLKVKRERSREAKHFRALQGQWLNNGGKNNDRLAVQCKA